MSYITEIISQREQKTIVEYKREFQLKGEPLGNGFSFPCDEQGRIIKDDNYETGWKTNYEMCLSNPEKYTDRGAVKSEWSYTEPAVARCSCGRYVFLHGDCMCDCGQWYNQCGQVLKNPEQWEEDD